MSDFYDWADEPEAITERALELVDETYCPTGWMIATSTAIAVFAGVCAALVYVVWMVAA